MKKKKPTNTKELAFKVQKWNGLSEFIKRAKMKCLRQWKTYGRDI